MVGKEKKCAFCGSLRLAEVIDFGKVALAGAFLKEKDFPNEKKYQLTIVFCGNCFAVQVQDHIDPKVLFKHDFYFSSAIKTLRDHFVEYASEVAERFLDEPKQSVIVEFGSNDGVLLKPFADIGIKTLIGIDPAANVVESINDDRLTLVNDFFNVEVARKVVAEHGKADLVCANNVYAHISDINGITEAINVVMKDDGVFIFEVHYLGTILNEFQYDMMYHEHLYYYSLLALENHLARHRMLVFDIKPISIHGGSIRFYVCKKESMHATNISDAVIALRKDERSRGYDKIETYEMFARDCKERRRALMELLDSLRVEGKTVVGYGASGRANTIIQYCGIGPQHLDYLIDDAPAKQGFYTPGSHFLICTGEVLHGSDAPDYVLVFAWAFFSEIMTKSKDYIDAGGRFVVPLPEVRVFPEDAQVD